MIPEKDYPIVRTIYDKVTPLFLENFLSVDSEVINQGGTSSGKTYQILKVLAQRAIDYDGSITTVTGQDIPNLKDGSYSDFKSIIDETPKLRYAISKHNQSEREFTFKNGSRVQFKAYDNAQDAKNGKRDFLFVNEANGISYDIYSELQVRTRYQTFLDYNPNAEFWVHDKILTKQTGVKYIESTWQDNPYIPENIKQKILAYKDTDPYRWQVYGLGKIGKLEGLVFSDWIEVESMPNGYDYVIWGLDFGFTNDPTAVVKIYYSGRNIYVDTKIYETGLTNEAIADKLQLCGFTSEDVIYCDSAEPKSIAELSFCGINALPTIKGQDSIKAGISKLSEYKVHYLRSDAVLRKEINNYIWAKDANGRPLNKPIDAYNHIPDAIRGAVYTHSFIN